MYQEQIEKQKAYVDHLFGLFLEIKEIYSFLEPMLFNKTVIDKYGQGTKARGFNAIKFSLFYACIQDLANLYADTDPKTPTIEKALNALENELLRNALREDFSITFIEHSPDLDPLVAEMWKGKDKQKEERRRQDFDGIYQSTLDLVAQKSLSEEFAKFKVIRDKLTAHSELKKYGSDYKLLDVSTLGITWGSVGTAIRQIQQIICNLNMLIRSAAFDFDEANKNLESACASYWEV